MPNVSFQVHCPKCPDVQQGTSTSIENMKKMFDVGEKITVIGLRCNHVFPLSDAEVEKLRKLSRNCRLTQSTIGPHVCTGVFCVHDEHTNQADEAVHSGTAAQGGGGVASFTTRQAAHVGHRYHLRRWAVRERIFNINRRLSGKTDSPAGGTSQTRMATALAAGEEYSSSDRDRDKESHEASCSEYRC